MKALFFILLFISMKAEGQSINLIPNAGFEFSSFNYSGFFFDSSIVDNYGVYCWGVGNNVDGFYANTQLYDPDNIQGFVWPAQHYPKTGHSYLTLQMKTTYDFIHNDSTFDHRTYIQSHLLQPLIAGISYRFEMYISSILDSTLIPGTMYTTSDRIGVYFSHARPYGINSGVFGIIPQINFINLNPITNNTQWIHVIGYYTAVGGEEYITIGNFDSYKNTIFLL